MSLYGIVETTVVSAAVAGGALSALRTFAPSAFRRLFVWHNAGTEPADVALPQKAAGCSECSTCGGCERRNADPS
jgi:hypothetical protein